MIGNEVCQYSNNFDGVSMKIEWKKKKNLSLICLTTIIFIIYFFFFHLFCFKSYWFDKWNKTTSIVISTIFVTFPFYCPLLHFSHIIEQIRQQAERHSIISIIRIKENIWEFSSSSFNEQFPPNSFLSYKISFLARPGRHNFTIPSRGETWRDINARP